MAARVMIIDPSLYNRMVLSHILVTHGYSVCYETGSPAEALANYEKTRPDFVLVEARMPEKDGVSTIRDLCAKFHGCTALLCASSGQRGDVCAAMSAGAVDFIVKPYSERAVIHTLRRIGIREKAS